jgi:hypothetical protein
MITTPIEVNVFSIIYYAMPLAVCIGLKLFFDIRYEKTRRKHWDELRNFTFKD